MPSVDNLHRILSLCASKYARTQTAKSRRKCTKLFPSLISLAILLSIRIAVIRSQIGVVIVAKCTHPRSDQIRCSLLCMHEQNNTGGGSAHRRTNFEASSRSELLTWPHNSCNGERHAAGVACARNILRFDQTIDEKLGSVTSSHARA